jgi:arsenate reductase (thioredoxin)
MIVLSRVFLLHLQAWLRYTTENCGPLPQRRSTAMTQRVLFICTHNSARSQMAEGWLRHLGGAQFEAFSAGTEATQVRPLAIRAMAEVGIDIAGQQSKTLDRYLAEPFDAVITVCDSAAEACPVFGGAKHQRHWSFPDPSKATGSEQEQLAVYWHVRDAIRARIEAELLSNRGEA